MWVLKQHISQLIAHVKASSKIIDMNKRDWKRPIAINKLGALSYARA